MLGHLNPNSKEVTIVGAGISGLLAAYYLERAGFHVQLIEASEKAGGLISTERSPNGLVEAAAHSFPTTPTMIELCKDLGVELCAVGSGLPGSKRRWIYRGGKSRRFPLDLFETLSVFFRAYFVLAPSRDPETLTLEEWARRFLGETALRYLVTPFVRGIYGAEPREILVSAAFPALCVPRGHSLVSYLLARRWRKVPPSGVRRAISRIPRGEISAPLHGMQALTTALEDRVLQRLGNRFEKGRRLNSLTEIPPGRNLVLCVPADEAAKLLAPESAELSGLLSSVEYSPLTSATIFVNQKSFRRVPRGLGILVPQAEHRSCLGILYNSSAFKGRVTRADVVSLTMMLDCSVEESRLPEVIQSELLALFKVREAPLEIRFHRSMRAVPKYDALLLKTWETAEKTWCASPGNILFGNYTGQVSIRGMAELAAQLH